MQNRKWKMPSFPEITWANIKTMEFLGSVKADEVMRRDNEI